MWRLHSAWQERTHGSRGAGQLTDMTSTPPTPYRYWAFISYSHADSAAAARIHRWLESYRLPLAARDRHAAPERLFPIFRDRDELPGAANLGELLIKALSEASALIVLCSPASARSHWVSEEILYFKRTGRAQRIFQVILAGEPYSSEKAAEKAGANADDECFPLALRRLLDDDGNISDLPAEPLAVDLRPGKDGMRLAMLKLIAGVAEVPLATLQQRDALRRQRNLQRIVAGVSVIAVLLLGLLVDAILSRRETERQRNIAEQRRIETLGRQLAAESVNQLHSHPDGALLYALAANRISPQPASLAALWRSVLESATLEQVIPTHIGASALAVAEDGATAFIGGEDGQIRMVQAGAGAPRVTSWPAHKGRVTALAALSNNAVVSASTDGQMMLHDAQGINLAPPFTLDDDMVLALAADPTRNAVFAGSQKGVLLRWENQPTQPAKLMVRAHQGAIWALALAPHGDWLATGSSDGQLALWNNSLSPLPCQAVLSSAAIALAAHPTLPLLAVLDANSVLTLLRIPGCTPAAPPLLQFRRSVAGTGTQLLAKIAFSADGSKLIFPVNGGKVMAWAWDGPGSITQPATAVAHRANVIALASSASRLLTLDSEGKLLLHRRVGDVTPSRNLLAHQSKTRRVAYSPDGRYLASVGYDHTVRIWDAHTLTSLGEPLTGHSARLLALAWSPNSRVLATAGGDGSIRLWPAAQQFRQPTILVTPHQDEISALAYSADGKTLVSASYDGKVLLWPIPRSTAPLSIATGNAVQTLAIDPAGVWLASGGDDKLVHLWRLRDGQPLRAPLAQHAKLADAAITALAVSPSGRHLYSAGNDGTVLRWDTQTWQASILPLESHDLRIIGMALSPDEKLLVLARQDGRAVAFSLEGGTVRIGGLSDDITDLGVAIDPSGLNLAIGAADGTLRVWSLQMADWIALACHKANRPLGASEWLSLTGSAQVPAVCPPKTPQ